MNLSYPDSPTVDVREVLAGVSFADPYRWLEDDNLRVREWQKAQGELAADYVREWPHFDALRALVARFYEPRFDSVPRYAGGLWFWSNIEDGCSQAQALVGSEPLVDGRVLFDPMLEDPESPPFLSWLSPSPDGRTLAVGLCVTVVKTTRSS